MAKYKTLKSVAHNIGYSFISSMNYNKDDYALGHIQTQMLATNLDKLEIDLLKNESKPAELLTEAIQKSINQYAQWLPKMVTDSKSNMDLIRKATLTIEFDLTKSRAYSNSPEYTENPYICVSCIVDDRGKEYRYEFKGWWFPSKIDKPNWIERLKLWWLKN